MASLEAMRSRGETPKIIWQRAIAADNAVIAGFPEVTFGLHVCRGNRQSMWHREGAYDAIADMLFNGLHHQRLLLEYDTDRAGGFEPLRFVSKDKIVVLGLITTKGRVETVDELKRRIEEAARYCPSSSSRSARNAASRPTSAATSSVKTRSGASWMSCWKRPTRSGARTTRTRPDEFSS